MNIINPWRKVYDCPQSVDPWKNGVPDFALYIDVEPTNNCNFNCSFCVRKQMKRQIGYMDIRLFDKICMQAEQYGCKGIRFLRWGEPLLHPNIIDMVKIAKDHNLLTHITTNGNCWDEKRCCNLINSGLDSIIISLQGTTPEEYVHIRNSDYDKIYNNILCLYNIRNSMNKYNPHIAISTTITDENELQINNFKQKWENIVDHIGIGYTWFKRLKNKDGIEDLVNRSRELPHLFKCQEVMVKLSIDWDGTISPCCLDYDQQLSIGNVAKDDLLDVWKSKDIISIRNLLSNKKQDMFVLCSTCELNYSFRGKTNG